VRETAALLPCPSPRPPLQLELRKLEDRVEGVYRELQYQREREEEHRNTNESTNSRVQWFSILTILIVVSTAATQVWYLFSFFKRKKLM
jgi:p24 family protein delta-1